MDGDESHHHFATWLHDIQLKAEDRQLFPRGMDLRVLRQNSLTKRWTLYNQNKAGGPEKPRAYVDAGRSSLRALEQPEYDTTGRCPFCPGTEASLTPAELCRVWPNGELQEKEGLPKDEKLLQCWAARAVRNKFPYLATPADLYSMPFPGGGPSALSGELDNAWTNDQPESALYPQVDGFGASEVIIESPKHNAQLAITTGQQVSYALRLLAARGRALRAHPKVKQLLFFKQYGSSGGGSLVHPHMQVHTLPIVSGMMETKLKQHREFFSSHCVCAVERLYVTDVTTPDSGGNARLVRETDHFVASVPYAAHAKCRLVIAPKRHFQHFEDCSDQEVDDLGSLLQLVMSAVYRQRDDPDYNVYWETLPTEHAIVDQADYEALKQSFRWTLHVRASRTRMGITNASGIEYSDMLPEQVAVRYRDFIDEELQSPLRNLPQTPQVDVMKQHLLAKEKEVEDLKRKIAALDAAAATPAPS